MFVANYTRQLFKWLTKGFYRTFSRALENTEKQVTAALADMCKYDVDECWSPRFITDDGGGSKKRRRRGHRGGRKHRRNKKNRTSHGKTT